MDGAVRTRLRDHPALLLFTVLGPLLEAAPLRYFHITAGLSPQLTAPVPFGVFHDLRWLLVFHRSWSTFALEFLALLVTRSMLTAATVRAAWPRGLPAPSWRSALVTSTVFTLVAVVLLSPWAALTFAGGATSLSWLPLAALPAFGLFALLLSHGGIRDTWWCQLPSGRTLCWTVATFLELCLAAALILLGPWWIAWFTAGLAGVFNAWAWRGVVGAVAAREAPSRRLPVVPITAIVLLGLVLGGATLKLRGSTAPAAASTIPPPAAELQRGEIPVLVAHGFDSEWAGQPEDLPLDDRFAAWNFSYAGIRADGRRKPYDARDTHEPIGVLETRMDAQVRVMHEYTGQPVRIIAVSEGSIVARSYLQAFPHAPVSDLVMLDPLVEPGRVYYPPAGKRGWGVVAGWEMRGIASLVRATSGVDLTPDLPFLRSVADHALALRRGVLCPAPQARVIALFPIASDASIPPTGEEPRVPVRVIPGFHGDGLADAARLLASGTVPSDPSRATRVRSEVLRAASTAWNVPELPVALHPHPEPPLDHNGCPTRGWPKPASS